MQHLNLLLKPASVNCNMRCTYCFYADVASHRQIASYGIMDQNTLENVVRKAFDYATKSCSFLFQGGEPTLAGLDYYRQLTELVTKYNQKKLTVTFSLQTNGYVINRDWAEFLSEHHFLVGLSLDGTKNVHDGYRIDKQGKGTFSKAMHAAQLLEQYGVDYNIVSVVTKDFAKNIGRIYGFYGRNNFRYQQYIPCLNPLEISSGLEGQLGIPPKEYGDFLIQLFDLWYSDWQRGNRLSIRYFDNLIGLLKGYPAESCDCVGHCTVQNVIEADGSVYPCDFYVLDRYCMGNLNDSDFQQLFHSDGAETFLQESAVRPEECRACKWFSLCRGGCRRDFTEFSFHTVHNYYCSSFQAFFEAAYPRLHSMAQQI